MILPSNFRYSMAIFSGNLISKTAIQLQTQVLDPWMKKKMKTGTIITCSKRRDYSNSLPVRYIPKKPSNTKESETSSTRNHLDDIEKHNSLESNAKGVELSSSGQTLYSSRSFVVDPKFQNQNEEKPIKNLKYGGELAIHRVVQSRVVQSNVGRIELSKSAQPAATSRSFVAEPEFQNQNEKSMNCVNNDAGLGTSRGFQSNVQRIELSKSEEASSSSRSFVIDTKFQNQNEIKNKNFNLALDKSRVVQSNVQRIECSESAHNSSKNSRSFATKFQNQYEKLINSDLGFGTTLGVGEELGSDIQHEDYEFMEELEGFSEEESNEGRQIQGVKIKQNVDKLAVELLAKRAFTAVELRKKLLGRKFPLDIVDAVITDFQGRGLINDCLYAETFSRSRWSSSTWGPRRIKKALYTKGVSEVDAQKAIKLVFNDTAASGDEESGLGMSKLSMDHLFTQASKRWLQSCGVSRETRKSRIVRWLQYRGFSWSIISVVLKKLESEYPS